MAGPAERDARIKSAHDECGGTVRPRLSYARRTLEVRAIRAFATLPLARETFQARVTPDHGAVHGVRRSCEGNAMMCERMGRSRWGCHMDARIPGSSPGRSAHDGLGASRATDVAGCDALSTRVGCAMTGTSGGHLGDSRAENVAVESRLSHFIPLYPGESHPIPANPT